MKPGDLLAVYGSLRRGEGADLSIAEDAEFVGEDKVKGELYSCGWYPGVKNAEDYEPGSDVTVEVFRVNSERRCARLDNYEGYPHLFDRKEVKTKEGRTAWIYTYNHDVSEDRRVQSGDWSKRDNKRV